MSLSPLAQSALQAFDDVVAADADFRDRPGQRQMAEQVARTFADVTLGKVEEGEAEPVRSIAVIQAGTGVGKSLAYCAPAIALALSRNTRVLISTATVALQEQLVNKDLPALAAQMPQPFRFALAKGRGRYVCKLKLNQLAGGGDGPEDELFADEEPEPATRFARAPEPRSPPALLRRHGARRWPAAPGAATATPCPFRPSPNSGARWPPTRAPAPASTARCSAAAPITTSARNWSARRSSWPTTTCCCPRWARACCPSWTTACWCWTKAITCRPRRWSSSPARWTSRAPTGWTSWPPAWCVSGGW